MKQNLGKDIEQKTGLIVLICKGKAVKTMWFIKHTIISPFDYILFP